MAGKTEYYASSIPPSPCPTTMPLPQLSHKRTAILDTKRAQVIHHNTELGGVGSILESILTDKYLIPRIGLIHNMLGTQLIPVLSIESHTQNQIVYSLRCVPFVRTGSQFFISFGDTILFSISKLPVLDPEWASKEIRFLKERDLLRSCSYYGIVGTNTNWVV